MTDEVDQERDDVHVAPPSDEDHELSEDCRCQPQIKYFDVESGHYRLLIHNELT